MITVADVYRVLDDFAPFSTQEKWDNSGLLVGSKSMPAERIYVTLDLSAETVAAAKAQHAQLMVAHHPIIFAPISRLEPHNPIWRLVTNQMAAICIHTPLDVAPAGINWRQHELLSPILALEQHPNILMETKPGFGFGWVDNSRRAWTAEELADTLRQVLDCTVVRYSPANRPIRKIAFCSGSAASELEQAIALGCDALITGDVKHDRWYAARNAGIALLDCGHYHTEQIAATILAEQITAALPETTVICDPFGDPVCYSTGDSL